MIIDCHVHIGRNENISASVSELLKSMDEAGIEKSLVFANKIGDASNEYMLEQIKPHKDRLYGVATSPGVFADFWHYKTTTNKIIQWYESKEIVAVKFYTGYEHYYPSDAVDVLSMLNNIGCPAIFHSGDCHMSCSKTAKLKYAHPLHIDEVAVDYPDMTFIIAHMGFPWVRDAAEVCYKNSNVYADMSGFVYGEFEASDRDKFYKCIKEFTEIASHDKLLFGTDWPISNQKSYIETIWGNENNQIYHTDAMREKNEIAKRVFKL